VKVTVMPAPIPGMLQAPVVTHDDVVALLITVDNRLLRIDHGGGVVSHYVIASLIGWTKSA